MDKERKKRLQTIRLIVTEIIMVIAVIITVIILTFVAMGYNVDKNGEFSQSGLVQIKSIPSGATVIIDDEPLLLHTNTSRMLDAGAHHVKLEKDGYTSWEKNIISESGVLLKLDYPRLFLEDRTTETIRSLKDNFEFFSVSPDRNSILYAEKSTFYDLLKRLPWTLLNVKGDDVTETSYDFSNILKSHEIISLKWNTNNDHLLVKTSNHDKIEWLLINLKNPENSSNLTLDFSLSFTDIKFANGSGERLIATENGNLRSISMSDHNISEVFARNIKTFSYNEPTITYLTNDNQLYLFSDGSEDILLKSFAEDHDIKFLTSSYLDRKYISFIDNNHLCVYHGNNYPNDDLSSLELALEADIDFAPESFYVWADNELFVATKDNNFAVFDAELDLLSTYATEGNFNYFLDNHIVGTISDNNLIVRDFDGTNRRELSAATGTAFIARNNRYLYYQNEKTIAREKILD